MTFTDAQNLAAEKLENGILSDVFWRTVLKEK